MKPHILKSDDEKEREREEKRKLSFRPHLWLLGSRPIPSPIFVVAMVGEKPFRYYKE